MADSTLQTRSRWARRWIPAAAIFGLLLAGVWISKDRWFDPSIRFALGKGAHAIGLKLENVEISGGIGTPLVLENLRFSRSVLAPLSSQTAITARRVEIAPDTLWALLFDRQRVIARLRVDGVQGVLDFRKDSFPPMDPLPSLTHEEHLRISRWILCFLPRKIELTIHELEILADDQRSVFQGVWGNFQEGKTGNFSVWKTSLEFASFSRAIQNAHAKTAWKEGVLYLSDLTLGEGILFRDSRIDLVRPGGVGISAEGDIFDGWFRADIGFGEISGRPSVDAMLWAGNVPVGKLISSAGFGDEAGGLLIEANLRFRGLPDEPADGEASIRLQAQDFSWKGRGWETLVVGAQMAHRRVLLAQFELKQKGNWITAKGDAGLPEGNEWFSSEWSATLDAEIEDLSSFATLLDPDWIETSGTLRAKGKVYSSSGGREGSLNVEGANLRWRGQDLGSFVGGFQLRGDELEFGPIDWKNKADTLVTSGQVRLADPHVYSGSLRLQVADVGPYVRMLPVEQPEEAATLSGGLNLEWQGDGTRTAHSGAFSVSMDAFHAGAIPEGINGSFQGTYSPENLLLRECKLEKGNFDLRWTLSAGKGGVFAEQIRFSAGKREMMSGQIYIPWDPRVLLKGEPWSAGVLEQRAVYADLQSKELDLFELAGLFGQSAPVTGKATFQVRAAGELASPQMNASLSLSNVRAVTEGKPLLSTKAAFQFQAQDGKADVSGSVEMPSLDPVKVDAKFPFGFRLEEEKLVWIDPTGSLEGQLTLPETELARFQPLLPDFRRFTGTVRGEILLGRTLINPSIDGLITLRGGELDLAFNTPPLRDFSMDCHFDGSTFRLENTGGTVGAGPFQITGGGDFSDPANVKLDLRLQGQKVLLARDRRIRLRADLDLQVRGGPTEGSVTGEVGLVDGRLLQRLEITPLLQASQVDSHAPLLLPDLSGHVPEPFSRWKADVNVVNKSPFLIAGNIASGEINPDLKVLGTLGDPRPTGTVRLIGLRAYLPFSVVTIPEGIITFREESPRIPDLDVRGFSEILEYEVQMLAYGPLDEKNLILRSDPPLPQESILLLLTAGLAPGINTGAGFGEAAVGQGSLLLLKTFVRQFENEGVQLDSLINRVQVVTVPPESQGLSPILRGEFRMTDNFSIMAERDSFGYLGGGVTYTLRFR